MTRKLVSHVGDGIVLASAETALAFPPASDSFGLVTDWNQDAPIGAYPEFDLEIVANGSRALSAATLFAAHLHSITFADITVVANATTNEFESQEFGLPAAHNRLNGDGPVRFTTTGTFPGGVDGTSDWYVREGSDANHFRVAPTRADAMLGTNLVDLTSAGTGTIKLVDVAGGVSAGGTARVQWLNRGLLGPADDGVLDLTGQKGYVRRLTHSPRAIAYAVTATFGIGSGAVTIRAFPTVEL